MADRKSALKLILTAATLLGVVALAVVFFQFRRQQLQPLPIPDLATKALMTLAKVHQTATKDGKVQWELDAATAQLEADSGEMRLTSPRIVFFTDNGDKVLLTAEKGVLNTRNNDMQVSGNVRLRDDRYTLLTEALVYQHDRHILRTDVPVIIIGRAFDLRANKMTYNLEENLAQFDGQVKGNLHEDPAI